MIYSKKTNLVIRRSSAKRTTDEKLSNCVALYFIVQIVNSAAQKVFQLPAFIDTALYYLLLAILAVSILLYSRIIAKRGGRLLFAAESICVLAYVISYLMGNADTLNLINKAFFTCIVCIPLATCAFCVDDLDVLRTTMTRASVFIALIAGFALLFVVGRSRAAMYNMSLSYSLLLPSMLLIDNFIETRKVSSFLISALAVMAVTFFGARGPLLCCLWFVLIRTLFYIKSLRGRVGFLVIVILVAVLVLVFIPDVLSDGLLDVNRSRTLNLLKQGNLIAFFSSNSRIRLYKYYFDLASQKPLLGWGVTGGWISSGYYPHDIILELILSFGYILGSILGVLFLAVMLFPIITHKRRKQIPGMTYILALEAHCVSLLFSGTFLTTANLYILLFLIIKEWRKKRLKHIAAYESNQRK